MLLDIHDEWQAADGRYFSEASTAKLVARCDTEIAAIAEFGSE